jgi:hypothetical protein
MSEPGHLLDSLPDAPIGHSAPSRDRLPGIEWVVVSIIVICLTALYGINRREDAARLARHQQTQVQSQNEYQAPDGFGPLLSHGGEHEQHTYAP